MQNRHFPLITSFLPVFPLFWSLTWYFWTTSSMRNVWWLQCSWDCSQSQQMTFFSQKSRSFSLAPPGSPWNLWTSLLTLARCQLGLRFPSSWLVLHTEQLHSFFLLDHGPPCCLHWCKLFFSPSVTTVKAQGFCQKLQANGASHLPCRFTSFPEAMVTVPLLLPVLTSEGSLVHRSLHNWER